MKKSTKWFLGIFAALIVFGVIVYAVFAMLLFGLRGDETDLTTTIGTGDKVAVIELKGPIFESEQIVRQLKKFRDRNDVKALLLRVDSPGGGVAASQEIYEEMKRTKENGKPLVVSMGSVAASGGYYVSCPADRIVANRGTITGSIGVISQFLRFDPLMKKIGVEANTIKSGKFKDTGNPFREMTQEDRKYFQNLIDDVHRQFINVVEEERSLDHRTVVKYADGRVFTGEQALAVGLVDTLGTYEDAIRIAAEMGGIKGEPGIVKEEKRKRRLFDLFFESKINELLELKDELLNQPILQYRFIQ
jgi:protease-4